LPEPIRFCGEPQETERLPLAGFLHHALSQPFGPGTFELLVHFAQPKHIAVPYLHSLNAAKALPELLGSAFGAEHRDLNVAHQI